MCVSAGMRLFHWWSLCVAPRWRQCSASCVLRVSVFDSCSTGRMYFHLFVTFYCSCTSFQVACILKIKEVYFWEDESVIKAVMQTVWMFLCSAFGSPLCSVQRKTETCVRCILDLTFMTVSWKDQRQNIVSSYICQGWDRNGAVRIWHLINASDGFRRYRTQIPWSQQYDYWNSLWFFTFIQQNNTGAVSPMSFPSLHHLHSQFDFIKRL